MTRLALLIIVLLPFSPSDRLSSFSRLSPKSCRSSKRRATPRRRLQTGSQLCMDMITVMVKMDTVYSAVVAMANTENFCDRTDTAIAISLITLSVIVGIVAEVAYWIYAQTTNKTNDRLFTCLTTIGLFVFIFCSPLYFIADNHQPLDCAFGCDNIAANVTMEKSPSCNHIPKTGVRFMFNTISFIVVTTFSIVFFVYNTRAKVELEKPEIKEEPETTENSQSKGESPTKEPDPDTEAETEQNANHNDIKLQEVV